VSVTWVPGAFELPAAAHRIAASGEVDAIVCVGAVIRGETPHFDYVAGAAATGILQAAITTGVPITFGVLTVDTTEQAEARAGGKLGNKGFEAAMAAIEMANLFAALPKPQAWTIAGVEQRL
jgi:6,7-dimethyl-8-ribityllumazine synthase